jgi:hypothetical protein
MSTPSFPSQFQRSVTGQIPNMMADDFSSLIDRNLEATIQNLAASSRFNKDLSETKAAAHSKLPLDNDFEADDANQQRFVKEEARKAKEVTSSAAKRAAGAKTTGQRALFATQAEQVVHRPMTSETQTCRRKMLTTDFSACLLLWSFTFRV